MPINPSSKYFGSSVGSILPAFSISITRGRTCSSANAATASRNMISSSLSSVSADDAAVSIVTRSSSLPDARAVGVGTDHWIAILASPRCLELGHVAQWSVHPPLGRRMRIRAHQIPQELRPIELAPHLRPAEEEALLGSKSVDHRLRMRRQRALHRRISDCQTAEITDVLAQRELSLHVRRRIEHRVRVELLDDLLRLGVVTRCVFLAPPVTHVAELVVLPTLIVESV